MLAHQLGMTVPTEHARLRQASMRGLDFIVIGAQKAGTSSLFEHLRSHPELYIPPKKEYPFFSHDEKYAVGWSAYLSRAFRDAPAGTCWGTVTPWYMVGCPMDGITTRLGCSGGAWKLQRTAGRRGLGADHSEPNPCTDSGRQADRNPARSCFTLHLSLRDGCASRRADRGGFDRKIHDLLSPAALESSRRLEAPGYIAWGEYGRILKAYYDVFPREQIYVCFTSDLEHAPREFMQRLFGYLDVDPSFVPAHLGRRYRKAAASRRIRSSPGELERKLARQSWVRALWRLLPPGIQRSAVRRSGVANYRFELWNRRGGGFNRREASPEILDRLRAHYEEDRILLEELIGKPVPWRAAQVEK